MSPTSREDGGREQQGARRAVRRPRGSRRQAAAAGRGGGRGGALTGTAEQSRARRRHLHGVVLSRATAPTDAVRRRPAHRPVPRWRHRLPDRRASTGIATTSSSPCMHGLSGPIDGRSYPQVMVAMGTTTISGSPTSRRTCATVLETSGLWRHPPTSPGCGPPRARDRQWTVAELEASLPRALVPDPYLESHRQPRRTTRPQANAEGGYNYLGNAAGALSFLGWTTGAPQQPGMWFQIELPAPATLTELQFTSSTIGGRAGAPRRGRFQRVPGSGLSRGHDVERAGCGRSGQSGHDGHHVPAGEREVPAHHANRERRKRAALGDAAPPSLRGGAGQMSAGAFLQLIGRR